MCSSITNWKLLNQVASLKFKYQISDHPHHYLPYTARRWIFQESNTRTLCLLSTALACTFETPYTVIIPIVRNLIARAPGRDRGWPAGHGQSSLASFARGGARKASTINSSTNIMLGLWIQRWWRTILRKPSTSVRITVFFIFIEPKGQTDYTEKDKLGISGNRVLENRIRLKGSLKQNIKHCAPHGAQLQRWQGWWESFWLGVQGMNRRLECNELQTSVERRQHGSLTMTLFVHMNFPIC